MANSTPSIDSATPRDASEAPRSGQDPSFDPAVAAELPFWVAQPWLPLLIGVVGLLDAARLLTIAPGAVSFERSVLPYLSVYGVFLAAAIGMVLVLQPAWHRSTRQRADAIAADVRRYSEQLATLNNRPYAAGPRDEPFTAADRAFGACLQICNDHRAAFQQSLTHDPDCLKHLRFWSVFSLSHLFLPWLVRRVRIDLHERRAALTQWERDLAAAAAKDAAIRNLHEPIRQQVEQIAADLADIKKRLAAAHEHSPAGLQPHHDAFHAYKKRVATALQGCDFYAQRPEEPLAWRQLQAAHSAVTPLRTDAEALNIELVALQRDREAYLQQLKVAFAACAALKQEVDAERRSPLRVATGRYLACYNRAQQTLAHHGDVRGPRARYSAAITACTDVQQRINYERSHLQRKRAVLAAICGHQQALEQLALRIEQIRTHTPDALEGVQDSHAAARNYVDHCLTRLCKVDDDDWEAATTPIHLEQHVIAPITRVANELDQIEQARTECHAAWSALAQALHDFAATCAAAEQAQEPIAVAEFQAIHAMIERELTAARSERGAKARYAAFTEQARKRLQALERIHERLAVKRRHLAELVALRPTCADLQRQRWEWGQRFTTQWADVDPHLHAATAALEARIAALRAPTLSDEPARPTPGTGYIAALPTEEHMQAQLVQFLKQAQEHVQARFDALAQQFNAYAERRRTCERALADLAAAIDAVTPRTGAARHDRAVDHGRPVCCAEFRTWSAQAREAIDALADALCDPGQIAHSSATLQQCEQHARQLIRDVGEKDRLLTAVYAQDDRLRQFEDQVVESRKHIPAGLDEAIGRRDELKAALRTLHARLTQPVRQGEEDWRRMLEAEFLVVHVVRPLKEHQAKLDEIKQAHRELGVQLKATQTAVQALAAALKDAESADSGLRVNLAEFSGGHEEVQQRVDRIAREYSTSARPDEYPQLAAELQQTTATATQLSERLQTKRKLAESINGRLAKIAHLEQHMAQPRLDALLGQARSLLLHAREELERGLAELRASYLPEDWAQRFTQAWLDAEFQTRYDNAQAALRAAAKLLHDSEVWRSKAESTLQTLQSRLSTLDDRKTKINRSDVIQEYVTLQQWLDEIKRQSEGLFHQPLDRAVQQQDQLFQHYQELCDVCEALTGRLRERTELVERIRQNRKELDDALERFVASLHAEELRGDQGRKLRCDQLQTRARALQQEVRRIGDNAERSVDNQVLKQWDTQLEHNLQRTRSVGMSERTTEDVESLARLEHDFQERKKAFDELRDLTGFCTNIESLAERLDKKTASDHCTRLNSIKIDLERAAGARTIGDHELDAIVARVRELKRDLNDVLTKLYQEVQQWAKYRQAQPLHWRCLEGMRRDLAEQANLCAKYAPQGKVAPANNDELHSFCKVLPDLYRLTHELIDNHTNLMYRQGEIDQMKAAVQNGSREFFAMIDNFTAAAQQAGQLHVAHSYLQQARAALESHTFQQVKLEARQGVPVDKVDL